MERMSHISFSFEGLFAGQEKETIFVHRRYAPFRGGELVFVLCGPPCTDGVSV